MTVQMLACPRCKQLLPPTMLAGTQQLLCGRCGEVETIIFPAWFAPPPPVERGERIVMESDACCFYHHENRARIACDACGRFLCGLCEIRLDEARLCPVCMESGQRKGTLKKLQREEMLWDRLALTIAALSYLIIFAAPFGFLAVVFLTIRYWNTPRQSIIPRTRIRFYAALVLSLIVNVAITGFFIAIKQRG